MTALALDFAVDFQAWEGLGGMPDDIAHRFAKGTTTVYTQGAVERSELAWLSKTYSLVAKLAVDSAVDLVFDHFDDLLHGEKFREADEALAAVDIKRLDSNLMVALLTITHAAKENLRRREDLVRRIEKKLEADAPDRAEQLLAGLR